MTSTTLASTALRRVPEPTQRTGWIPAPRLRGGRHCAGMTCPRETSDGAPSPIPTVAHVIIDPEKRWFPADESLRESGMEKLPPPLVAELRKKVKEFRDRGYVGATDTGTALLNWWFNTEHLVPAPDDAAAKFQYYFAQREALETIVYLHDVVGVKDKFDLMRFDSSGYVSASMFDESWVRFVIKMATGSGKTKVMSLAIAWSFFSKTYEEDSDLSRNFLVIAPNIIVLDRLYKDFKGLQIFYGDPVLPGNGYEGRNWRDDFQLRLHKQDEVRVTEPTGNIFLTNIHRVYSGDDTPPSPDDENTMAYFLGPRPTGATTDSSVDLGDIVRDIDELMVLNDEAHHVHDKKLAWFKSIEDIHNRLLQKGDRLSLQIDVTATPKRNNGAIFVQTVVDYPLVEAIAQNVVKHPVVPDAASRTKLHEQKSSKFTEKYADYLELGVIEWRMACEEHIKAGKKSVLFVMTDDTKNCDEVAEYLEARYPDLQGGVLVIHTKNNGEVSEAQTGKAKEELDRLRELAKTIDDASTPWKAIVSVMMLKEGWDVRNVTTIVGLRAYSAKSNILPEQTLGRGLRRMYPSDMVPEYVSVVGTDAFMDFVDSIKAEGVELERRPMGERTKPNTPLVVEVDRENDKMDIDELDIEIPVLTPRTYREYKNIADLDVGKLGHQSIMYREFSPEEQREIAFTYVAADGTHHTTRLDSAGIGDYRSALGYFAHTIMKELRLVGCYDVLYPKVKEFVEHHVFGDTIDLDNPNTIRNLSESVATKTIIETLKKGINDLTVRDKGDAEIRDTIKLRNTRTIVMKDQEYIVPKKSVFNRIVGDSHLELRFAKFLDDCDEEITSYAKNYLAVHFKLDYVNSPGNISHYYPDLLLKLRDGKIVIVETKGQQDLDVPLKMARLRQWCEDINRLQSEVAYDFVFVDEESFDRYKPRSVRDLLDGFREYKL
jgi:type III restriction enzyme